VVRRFARFASAIESRTEVPPDGLLPPRVRRKEPYLYSQAEIVDLIHAATKIRSPKGLRAKTYPTLFGLLAVSGMRLSEPLALDRDDVDLAGGMLTIRRTKFRKSRLVPIHPTTCRALKRYARARDRIYPRPPTPAFFLSDDGVRLTQWAVRWAFVSISRQIGLRGPSDHTGPRIHDLRHAFALRTVLDWYRRGVDVEQRMPVLATYLGHVHVADTYWYLTAAPELLRWAAKRVEGRRGGHQR
jgi:integrase/recombinase XerD